MKKGIPFDDLQTTHVPLFKPAKMEMGGFHYSLPHDLRNIASNRGPLRIRDITACRFAKGMPEILSYKFDTEIGSQQEHSNISSTEARKQHESPDVANENQSNEVIMGELESEANSRTVASEPSDSNQDDECDLSSEVVCEKDADLILSGDKLTAGVNEVIRTNVIINHPEDTNCKDRNQEFWNNVEESLRVYNLLSLCVTEKNGVEGVPN